MDRRDSGPSSHGEARCARSRRTPAALGAAVPLTGLFTELEAIAAAGLTAAGFRPPDVALVVRFTFGVTLAIAVLDDWLLPKGRQRPSRQRIVDELVAFVTLGVNRYPLAGVGRQRGKR